MAIVIQKANPPSANRISEISVSSPLVPEKTNAYKAESAKVLAGIMDYAADQYDKRMEKIRARRRAEAVAAEAVETGRFSRDVFAEAQKLQDDEAVMPYIREKMQGRLDALNEKYGSDPELQSKIFEQTQRYSLQLEDSAFNFVEQRQGQRHIATLEQLIFDSKNDILNTGSEAVRAEKFKEIDAAIIGAQSMNYLNPVQAGDLMRNTRSEVITSIIQKSIANGDIGYASAYMTANLGYIPSEKQAALQTMIMNKREAMANAAAMRELKELTKRNKINEYMSEGGAKSVDALELMSMPTDNPISNAENTNYQAAFSTAQYKQIFGLLDSGQMDASDLITQVRQWPPRVQEAFINGAESIKEDMGWLKVTLTTMKSQYIDDREKTKIINQAISARGDKEQAALKEIYDGGVIFDAVRANPDFQHWVDAESRWSARRLRPSEVSDMANTVSAVAAMKIPASSLGSKDSIKAAAQDAVASAIRMLPSQDDYANVDGVKFSVPQNVGDIMIDKQVVAGQVFKAKQSVMDNPDKYEVGNMSSTATKAFLENPDNIKFVKNPTVGDNELILMTKDDVPVLYKDTKRAVRMRFDDAMWLHHRALNKDNLPTGPQQPTQLPEKVLP